MEAPPPALLRWPTRVPGSSTRETFGKAFSSDVTGDGPSHQRLPVSLSVSYPRASIFTGLPSESVRESVDSILSDRLSQSSHASIRAAVGHWSVVARRHVWPRLIPADDPMRGGKLATFVSYLVYETELKASSISNYVWGFRQWLKLQHLPDPIFGVLDWDDFMQAVDVVAWVAREPRKPVPLSVIQASLEQVDLSSFVEVQAALLIVMLFFTFARSESPCPKSFSGQGSFDPTKHLQVMDVEIRMSGEGRAYLAVRLKSIKQDPRMERPEASGGEDWIFIGNVEGPFSVLAWLSRFWSFFPADGSSPPRPADSPFFRDGDRARVLTYTNAMRDVRALYSKVAPPGDVASYGLHGLRVEAYNRARAHDPLLAVAQGGWASVAHTRYARFTTREVLALPGAMVAEAQSSIVSAGAALLELAEPPVEVVAPFSAGPRLGRARTGRGGGSSLSPIPAPPPRPVPASSHGARLRSRKSKSTPRGGLSPPPVVPPPAAPPPPVVRRSNRGGSRAAAFSGNYSH